MSLGYLYVKAKSSLGLHVFAYTLVCGERIVWEEASVTGEEQIASYLAIIAGLVKAHELGLRRILCYNDLQSVIRHITGEYLSEDKNINAVIEEIRTKTKEFQNVSFNWLNTNEKYLVQTNRLCVEHLSQVNKVDTNLSK